MKNLLNNLRQRHSGCSGPDAFSAFLTVLSMVFAALSRLPRMRWMQFLALLLLAFALYRMLSSDRTRRTAENRRFLGVWKRLGDWCALRVKMVREYRTHRYLRCPSCRARLRVKRVKGRHTVACPHCGGRFEATIR